MTVRKSRSRRLAFGVLRLITFTFFLCHSSSISEQKCKAFVSPGISLGSHLARFAETRLKWMKTSRLLAFSASSAFVFLLARPLGASNWSVFFKVLCILLLAVVGFRVDRWLGRALTVSSLGDFLLGVPRLGELDGESLFLLGLGSFLVAHLLYIAMFRNYRAFSWRRPRVVRVLGVVAILVAFAALLGTLWQSLGSMLIPVVAYSLVLSGMGIGAMLADLGTPLAGFGAVLFIASDAMIAISKFRNPFPYSEQLVWITYYAAQFFILRAVECHHSRNQRTP